MIDDDAKSLAGADPDETDAITVLVVDDELHVRSILAEGLEMFGYTVLQAASADEALRLIHDRQDVRMVVSDIRMPGMTGVELAVRVAEMRHDLKFVLMSGYHNDAPTNRVVLRKPFSIGQLDAAIRDGLTASP